MNRSGSIEGLDVMLADIELMDRKQCFGMWRKMVGPQIPKSMSVQFMRKALMYELQGRKLGRQSASAKRTLRVVAGGKKVTGAIRPALQAGTHLVREWNGRTYQVKVIDGGFELDGKRYKSLTAIARKITGARWSGPRFFGLDQAVGARADAGKLQPQSNADLETAI